MRLTLTLGKWYVLEMIGDAFGPALRQYRLIRVQAIRPTPTGPRVVELQFSDAHDPEGVCTTRYTLLVLEQGERFLLAKSPHHTPPRFLLLYDITAEWLWEHACVALPAACEVDTWLNQQA